MTWPLKFISEQNFREHVRNTIRHYGEKLTSYNLERFNSNIIDPIKLIFDRTVYRSEPPHAIRAKLCWQKAEGS